MTVIQGSLASPIFKIVSQVARDKGVRAFVIGGYVRDCLLGRPSKDIDIVVEGSGIDLALSVGEKVGSYVSVFKNFGTAMLRYKGAEVEFVGARKESYSHDSRNPIVEDGTLEEDQQRRDFTINAMALSLQEDDFETLVDPFGGVKDLSEGIIRTPLDPDTTYSDDPLRMLRAVRFATTLSTAEHHFEIVRESLDSMRRNASRMNILSKERISVELGKILCAPKPSIGLRLLDQTGLLDYIIPQLSLLKGTEMVDGRGHKDNFSHTLQVVDNLAEAEIAAIAQGQAYDYVPIENGSEKVLRTAPNEWLRWAGLLHDIGKPSSKRFDPAKGWTFNGHEVIGSKMVPKIFRSLKMPENEKMKYVQKLVALHLRPIALVTDEVTDSAVRRLLFDAGDEIDDLMLLCNADITSKNPAKVRRLHENFVLVEQKIAEVEAKDQIRNFKNPIDGNYVMELFGIPPCSTIAVLKDYVKEAILDGSIPNEFEAADRLMREKALELGLQPKL